MPCRLPKLYCQCENRPENFGYSRHPLSLKTQQAPEIRKLIFLL